MRQLDCDVGTGPGSSTGKSIVDRCGWWLLGACLPVWLAGCATGADPHEGGFVSGIAGLAGGGYQRRIDEREGTHQDEMDAQQGLKAQARAIEQERAQVRGDLAKARDRLANQEQRIAAERARLIAERRHSATTQAALRQLDQAQARVTNTQGELRTVRVHEQSVGDLQTRSRAIQEELDEIESMVSVVSESRF